MTKQNEIKERVLIIFIFEGRFLLGPMRTHKLSANGSPYPWGLPGGTRRVGEEVLETAQREGGEETRQWLSRQRFKRLKSVVDGGDVYHICSARLSPQEFREHVPTHKEFLRLEWVTLKQVRWEHMLPWCKTKLLPILYTELRRKS